MSHTQSTTVLNVKVNMHCYAMMSRKLTHFDCLGPTVNLNHNFENFHDFESPSMRLRQLGSAAPEALGERERAVGRASEHASGRVSHRDEFVLYFPNLLHARSRAAVERRHGKADFL